MPAAVTYPGVYVEEIPSGVHPITGVATSIAAFVDFFKRGPMNTAVQILSFADFERTFGGLDARSEASYAVQQFFLNGGAQAWVVRVASGSGSNIQTKADVIVQRPSSAAAALTLTAASEGTWGNGLRARIDHATAGATAFNLTVFEVDRSGTRPVIVAEETFRELSMTPSDSRFVDTVLKAGQPLARATASGTDRPPESGTVTTADFAPLALGTHKTKVKIAYNEGIPSSDEFDVDLGNAPIATVDEAAGRLEGAIRSAIPTKPAWAATSVRAMGHRLQILAGPSRPAAVVTFSNTSDDTATTGALKLETASANVTTYALGSSLGSISGTKQGAATVGQDGVPPDAMALVGSGAVTPATGMFALDKADLFNILCLPRVARRDGDAPFAEGQVATALSSAENYCDRRRAFLLVDTPSNVTNVIQFQEWLNATLSTLRNRNAAAYFPRLEIADPKNDFRSRSCGASGTVAGIYARTDAERGVWKAPAGIEAVLRGAQKLEYKLSDAENGVLNPLGINCLRTFDVYGNVCWGARTLDGSDQQASEWKYVPVRRTALFLEESLYRGTQWVVFEPNDEPLWAQIRLNVGSFMHTLFRQGAFQGKTPREAYLVKCDGETTTPEDVNLGVVNILVGFAPLKPAEFVIVRIQQMAGQTAA